MRHRNFSLGGRRGRLALRLALLALPVLFWSAVFAVLAGVRPTQGVVAAAPVAAQVLMALACPLVAMILGAGERGAAGGVIARRRGGVAHAARPRVMWISTKGAWSFTRCRRGRQASILKLRLKEKLRGPCDSEGGV